MAKKDYKLRGQHGCLMCAFTCYDTETQVKHFLKEHSKKKAAEPKEGDPPWPCEYCGEGFRTVERSKPSL